MNYMILSFTKEKLCNLSKFPMYLVGAEAWYAIYTKTVKPSLLKGVLHKDSVFPSQYSAG